MNGFAVDSRQAFHRDAVHSLVQIRFQCHTTVRFSAPYVAESSVLAAFLGPGISELEQGHSHGPSSNNLAGTGLSLKKLGLASHSPWCEMSQESSHCMRRSLMVTASYLSATSVPSISRQATRDGVVAYLRHDS